MISGVIFLIVACGFMFHAGSSYGKLVDANIFSPSGKLKINFFLADGVPYYSITYNETDVIQPSSLGFVLGREGFMDRGFVVKRTMERSFNETWEPVWGETREITNHYNELIIQLEEAEKPKRRMNLVFRVFNDGVGFRYEVPEQENLENFEIMSEETYFAFTGDHTCWWIPADFNSYEHLYTESPLKHVIAVNTPVTMKTADGLYLSVHEANLTNYAGMTLSAVEDEEYTLKSSLVPWPDGSKVKASTPLVSPWRTVQIATRPGDLIESNLILNLNEPNKIEDTSWIKPMKYIGIWWGMHIKKYTWHMGPKHGATTKTAKQYIDFASEHGIPGVLIEGWNTGWERWGAEGAYDYVTPYPDFDIEEVVSYARERDVFLIGHHETGGDARGYERQLDSAFGLYEKLGIPAVKTGYAGGIYPRGQHHHGQWMVNHYRKVVKEAAKHHLMLDVHEPIKPTGIRRTYPNMMTREGVRGMEYNAWSEGNPPEHTTILPFTRMLAGPADYTPGIFDLFFDRYQEDNRVYTTLAKQLALYVVLYSPLQMAADLPENYENQPAFEFIQSVPVNWDDIKVLNAKIGDYVTIARKNGDNWFIGSITDEEARVLLAKLFFLDAGRKYKARIYADTPYTDWETNPGLIDISEFLVDRNTTLTLKLARGGGQAINIMPVVEK